MKRLKLIMMALFFVFVTGSFLAACSSDDVKGSNDEGSGNTENEGNANDTENMDDADDGNKEPINFYISSSTKPTADKYVEELERLSGFELNFEYVDEYNEKLPVLFASGDLPDVIQTAGIRDSLHQGAVENGVFMELGPLIEEHGKHILENIPEDVWTDPRVSMDGKIYAFPRPVGIANSKITYIRQDWLDKLDMDVPRTLDEWLAYFEAVKQNDMNENGDPNDEYGFSTRKGQSDSTMFFGAFGVTPEAWHMQDGKMIPDMIMPETKEAIAFYEKLYSEGYINPDMFSRETVDWVNANMSGKAGSWQYVVEGYKVAFNPSQEGVDLPDDAEIKLIPPPVGPDGESGLGAEGDGIYSVRVIPADTESPERIIKYWDWAWSSEEAEKFFAFGIEDYNYEVDNGEILWDANDPVNLDNNTSTLYQVYINPRGDARMKPRTLETMEEGDVLQEAINISEEYMIGDDAARMPTLEAFKPAPELVPGVEEGTLFLEMFAKVVTGKEELDPAFDKFVETWKKRGGEEAIEEATDWYNNFYEN